MTRQVAVLLPGDVAGVKLGSAASRWIEPTEEPISNRSDQNKAWQRRDDVAYPRGPVRVKSMQPWSQYLTRKFTSASQNDYERY